MDTFRWIAVVVSMILGLGVTRLLSSAVAVFKSRRRASVDWLPLVWALVIFVQQIDFWWSLEELSVLVPKWTFAEFLMLVALVLVLFLAAALILPQAEMERGDTLRGFFDRDGRYALVALAVFSLLAILANLIFWDVRIVGLENAINLLLGALAVVTMARSRSTQVAATGAYIVVLLIGILQLSPTSY
jgi:hypothetical protein